MFDRKKNGILITLQFLFLHKNPAYNRAESDRISKTLQKQRSHGKTLYLFTTLFRILLNTSEFTLTISWNVPQYYLLALKILLIHNNMFEFNLLKTNLYLTVSKS